MLRPFAHPVACCCAEFETSQLFATCKQMQQLPKMLGVLGQKCFVRLHGTLNSFESAQRSSENLRTFSATFGNLRDFIRYLQISSVTELTVLKSGTEQIEFLKKSFV